MIHDILQLKVDGEIVFMSTRDEGFFNGIEISFNIIKNELINKKNELINKKIEEKIVEPEVVVEEKEEEQETDVVEIQEEKKIEVELVRKIVFKSPKEWADELCECVFEELKTVKKGHKIYARDIYDIVAKKGVPMELVEDTGVEIVNLFKTKGKIAGK